jgi:hypothetical protein
MSDYSLLLETGGERPVMEALAADDDEEARRLAELRLALTTDFRQVAVLRGCELLTVLTRDSALRVARASPLNGRAQV